MTHRNKNLIRMKLNGVKAIKNLDFDIPNRKMAVFHNNDDTNEIEASLLQLNLGSQKLSSVDTEEVKFKKQSL